MKYSYYIADVFTGQPFHGVPLPVFTDATGLTDKKMLQIAGELNASNTIFLIFCEQKSTYSIKAFSKFEEVSIGSHSILAASYVLANIGSAIPAFANHICAHPQIQTGTHVFGIQRG
ncbi:MAG: PhzF family phenazine biosynthesis protein [Colwellia sp.]|nr:PhzF family phenazine biosynthesis protein [Colwellia sp.]